MFPGLSVLCCALFVYLHYADLEKKKKSKKSNWGFFLVILYISKF